MRAWAMCWLVAGKFQRNSIAGIPFGEQRLSPPMLDHREYKLLRLGNGMEVLVVRDAGYEDALVVMDVRAGLRDDPRHRRGLAHLYEHMLYTSHFDSVSVARMR